MCVLERMEATNEYEKYRNTHAIYEPEYSNLLKDIVEWSVSRVELSVLRCFTVRFEHNVERGKFRFPESNIFSIKANRRNIFIYY
jgi:hypothetical protein